MRFTKREGKMHRSRRVVVLCAAIAVAAAASAAYATIPDGSGVIHACYGHGTGILHVIDPSTGVPCGRNQSPLDWNARGRQGAPGPPGDQGPAGATGSQGPAGRDGTVSNLDSLNGVPCRGVRGKFATVRLDYGSGIEAPVGITCVTHLVANPGPFVFHVTSGMISLAFLGDLPLPTTGWQLSGSIDLGGKITAQGSAFQTTVIPFSSSAPLGGFSSVSVNGTITLSSTSITGALDPEPGTASLTGGLYATLAMTATTPLVGTLYSGTCAFGTSAAAMPMTLSTASPGTAYSQSTGALTLSSPLTAPSFDSCSPAMPGVYGFLLNLFAGSGRITLSGTTDPILKAT